jgi:hypothetical protein
MQSDLQSRPFLLPRLQQQFVLLELCKLTQKIETGCDYFPFEDRYIHLFHPSDLAGVSDKQLPCERVSPPLTLVVLSPMTCNLQVSSLEMFFLTLAKPETGIGTSGKRGTQVVRAIGSSLYY